jgi:hypothetical protein
MDFADELAALATRISRQKDQIQTEEATKTAFILPFISALGYNVFDPTEVTPELHADVGVKKGEKVDYAILKDGQPILLLECKDCRADLDHCHASQLYRYFSVTPARIGVVTNGIVYRFFSDLEQPNRMDEKPFLEVDLLNLREPAIQELKRLRKSSFDLDEMLSAASELKYTREIKRVFGEELVSPSDDLVRFFASRVYSGRLTQKVLEQFTDVVRRALGQYLSDRVSDRLRSALDQESAEEAAAKTLLDDSSAQDSGILTTDKEKQGFEIVRAIVSEVADPDRVVMRDTKSYCGILLDDNNRKPICRLHFDRAQWHVTLFDADKNAERMPLESLRDLYRYADRLRSVTQAYDAQ